MPGSSNATPVAVAAKTSGNATATSHATSNTITTMATDSSTSSSSCNRSVSQERQPDRVQELKGVLESMGIKDYHPNVIHQLLEFEYKYVTDLLEQAVVYCAHRGNSVAINEEDLRLAVQARADFVSSGPPPREFIAEMAGKINAIPLPVIPEKSGVHLPPDRFCLTADNYDVLPLSSSTLGKKRKTGNTQFDLPGVTNEEANAAKRAAYEKVARQAAAKKEMDAVEAVQPVKPLTTTQEIDSDEEDFQ
eukprot:UC4_evm2s1315